MAKICLVSCVKSKSDKPQKAKDLYTSALFEKAREVAENEFDKWYILSARYGLVPPDKKIDPYEQTLNKMSKDERLKWSKEIFKKLKRVIQPGDKITFFAGTNYREFLINDLEKLNCIIDFPMEGMSIGNQLKWLSFTKERRNILMDVERFYLLIDKLEKGLGGKRRISDLSGKDLIPKMGVYFFFEDSESRKFRPGTLRVTRVGTHAVSNGSKSTLWQRIKTHIGTNSGLGNHRGSIFRLHIGNSILNKNNISKKFKSWGIGQTGSKELRDKEKPIEEMVSNHIAKMSILWLEINDEASSTSDRAYIEKNAIGLLSFAVPAIEKPSRDWLGNYSVKECIRNSGLWNINHVGCGYDPSFLEIMERYVLATIGEIEHPTETLSINTGIDNFIKFDTNQMNLFTD